MKGQKNTADNAQKHGAAVRVKELCAAAAGEEHYRGHKKHSPQKAVCRGDHRRGLGIFYKDR